MEHIQPISKNRRHAGFTLIEVMVALVIIAISLGALLSSSGSQASSVAYLKQKTIAHWIAVNEITRLSVDKKFPDLGSATGSAEMANFEWYWSREVKATDDIATRQVTYTIFADSSREQNITVLTGYAIKQ